MTLPSCQTRKECVPGVATASVTIQTKIYAIVPWWGNVGVPAAKFKVKGGMPMCISETELLDRSLTNPKKCATELDHFLDFLKFLLGLDIVRNFTIQLDFDYRGFNST